MIFLTIRADKPEAEVGLYDGDKQLAYHIWHAHRELAETLHQRLDELLAGQGKTMADIQGIAAYEGPGSFTGLRIGLTVANATAYAYNLPVVATTGDDWIAKAADALASAKPRTYVLPEYGGEANISTPRK